MARRRKGGLTEEERALWQQVARTARPLHPAGTAAPAPPAAPPPAAMPRPSAAPSAPGGPATADGAESFAALLGPAPGAPAFRLGEKAPARRAHDLIAPLPERLAAAPPRMDGQAYRRMMRGKTAPEARLDLHGMTVAEAHPALIRFVVSAHARGLRLVLVITGKGKPAADHGPIPVRSGALRHQVPHWLHLPPLGPLVLQVAPAHLRHGGAGAYYVYLRRLR